MELAPIMPVDSDQRAARAELALECLPLAALILDPSDLMVLTANRRAIEGGILPGARPFDPSAAAIAALPSVFLRMDEADVEMSVTSLPDAAGLLLVEQTGHRRDVARLLQMIDGMPIAVMTADPDDDFKINYLNRVSRQIMQRIEAHLPVPADALLGSSLDVFRARLADQHDRLADPSRLPFSTRIDVGDEVLSLEATAITADDGRYLGPMVTWNLVTEEVELSNQVGAMVDRLARSSEQLNDQAYGLRRRAQTKAQVVSELTGAAERMDTVLKVISERVAHSAMLANRINEQANATRQFMHSLEEDAERIEHMSLAIGRIAKQTNLLALNATIEAARAGEAGRGFTVVAGEVKSLASEAAGTSAEIGGQLSGMRSSIEMTADAIRSITDEIAELVAAAAEVQRANIDQALSASAVNRSISEVRVAVEHAEDAADIVSGLAESLSEGAEGLRGKLTAFLA